MSKSSKLFRNPRAFIRDSWVWDSARALSTQLTVSGRAYTRKPAGEVPISGAVTPEVFRGLLRNGSLQVLTADQLEGGAEDVVTLVWREQLPEFILQAAVVADSLFAQLQIISAGELFRIARDNLRSSVQRLREAEAMNVRLVWEGRPECVLNVEVWQRNASMDLVFSRSNNIVAKRVPTTLFERCYDDDRKHVALRRLHAGTLDEDRPFDVDFVYTWVDHRDPHWRELITQYKDPSSVEWDRYVSVDELRYSLRSISQFAPWFRKVFIVTNCSPPSWFRPHSAIEFVSHESIFPQELDCLPTFSSHAIESCLARIPGIAEQFVYFNDDMFLGSSVTKADFFQSNGCSISQLESYGAVIGEVSDGNPDYLNAAINGRNLVFSKFQKVPTQLHRHVPYSLRRDVLLELEAEFSEHFARVRQSRFRQKTDISVPSFLYHHYAYQKKEAVRGNTPSLLINERRFKRLFEELLLREESYPFFCINDGDQSSSNSRYLTAKQEFLQRFFPQPAPWENPW